jgi:benzoate membrane transport protein
VTRVTSGLRSEVTGQAVAAGVSAAVLGYASSVAVVVAGLTAVGASAGQVGSGLLALGLVMGATSGALSAGLRVPVSVVWTTPGLALLPAVGEVEGGFPAAVGAFVVVGLLVLLTGLLPPVSRALRRLPVPLTSAVLAGVLLPFCLAPATGVAELPLEAGTIVLAWVLAWRFAPTYAAPAALLALVAVVAVTASLELPSGGGVPRLETTAPALSWTAVAQIALPVYLVTMAAQNLVGIAVLTSQGYRAPVGPVLVTTGVASALTAPFGAPTTNLAAITGALTAGPAAHADLERRWVAAAAAGATYVVLGALAPFTATVVTGTDPRLVATAAGLGLLGALVGAVTTAWSDERSRMPAAVTLLVSASGVTVLGLGAAPLGLLAGGVLLLLERTRR